jgi:predicted dehydrogenase
MASPDIGAVVVGTNYGVLTHVRALRNAGIAVLALVGRDHEKAKARADKLGVPHGLSDLEDALGLADVDVVSVTTPPHTHAPITLSALAAGKHILCEKPFMLDLGEARDVLSAAERAGVVHLMGFEKRFDAAQESLRRVVASGTIGEPRSALVIRHMPSLLDPATELPAWWESARGGGGWLGALGSHIVDQVRSTIGEFEAVSASLETLSPRPAMTADDTYTVQFRLAGGCTGILHSSCAVRGPGVATTKISGTRGGAWLQGEEVWVDVGDGLQRVPDPVDLPNVAPDPPSAEFLPAYAKGTGWHTSGRDLAPFTRVYSRLRARVLGEPTEDEPPAATFVDGASSQAVLDAARRSAGDGGRWVEVERV